MFKNARIIVDRPYYKLFKAPHEVIAQYNFKQGAFQNVFILYDKKQNFCASAVLNYKECFISVFTGYGDISPEIDDSNCNDLDLSSKYFPIEVKLSFHSINRDRLLSMQPIETRGVYKDIIIARDDKLAFSAIKISRDTYSCAGVSLDSLMKFDEILKPKPIAKPETTFSARLLQSIYSYFSQSPAFAFGQIQNGDIASTG